MFTKKHFINTFSVLFLIIINILFFFERSSSVVRSSLFYSGLYVLFIILLFWYFDKKLDYGKKIIRKRPILLFLFIILFFVAFEILFNVNNGGAYFSSFDWLTNLVNGRFPYDNSYTFNLPFLYYIDAPFFLLDNMGMISLFGLTLFLFLVLEFSYTKKEFIIRAIVLLFLPAVYFEIASGGDSFTNVALVISIMFLMSKFIDENKVDIKFFFLSVVFGALLCTRLLIIIPFLLSLLFFFRYNIKNLLLFILISLFCCLAILTPFIKWDYSSFAAYGPFAHNYLDFSTWVYILLFIVLVYTGWMISDLQELFFDSGIILFFISLISFMENGNYSDKMIICIPFLILSIKEYEVDKFLGKKIPIVS